MLNDLLNVSPGSINDVPADHLGELWTVFTKVKENIKDGRRLENLSWRLWYRELLAEQARHAANASPFLDSPPTEQPTLCADSEDTASEPEEANTDFDASATNVLASPSASSASNHTDASSPVTSRRQPLTSRRIRHSNKTIGARTRRTSRPLHNSHPDPASPVVRPPVLDRSNSTPTQSSEVPYVRTRRPPSFNLGKIMTSQLTALSELQPKTPHSLSDLLSHPSDVVPSSTVVTVEEPNTPPTSTTLAAPTLVVVQPTPRPTPPESPIASHNNSKLAALSVVMEDSTPRPTNSEMHESVPRTTSSGPGPPASSSMAPVPVDDPRKRKTFFFKESPGGDAGSASSTSTTVKTPAQPTEVQQAAQAVANALQVAAAAAVHKPIRAPVTKKGKEPVRAATRAALARQVTGRTGKAAVHARHQSNNVPKPGPPTRSKSSATIANLPAMATAGPSQVIRRTTSSSKLPPPSADSSAKTIVAPTPRVASPEPLEAPAPSPVQERARPQRERSAEKQPAKRDTSQPSRTIHTKNGRRLEVTTSSDFETTDTEGDDSSWASDYSDEEQQPQPKTGNIAKEAALEAARQRDMFQKIPTRSYTDLAKQPKAGLLTSMFHPDPNIMPFLPMHHPFRAHNSAMNLGARPAPPVNVQATASKSSAAVPNVAQVTVTQNNIGVNTSGRPGYRLKGRPEDMEVESSDEEENEDDAVPISKSVAQRRLEALAGRIKKTAPAQPQPQPQQQQPQPPQRGSGRLQPLTPMAEHPAQTESISGSQFDMIPTGSIPINLPHPYNLPTPAPPSTPRTTRREMLATELSESLRRNILWERENGMRMFKRAAASTSRLQDRKPPVSVYHNDAYHATGW
ncbi:hypothetical protein FRB90_003271 [Tulasnella sp. 427]|nr:hypothetical protein FRB90_003271 [Tulasnella sp. 427]